MLRFGVISADSHVNAHPDTYVDRVPARFRDQAPRVEYTDEGDFWIFEGKRTSAVGQSHMAGKRPEEFKEFGQGGRFAEVRAGNFEASARLEDMDTDGVDCQVLYMGHKGGDAKDPELRMALLRAYHDWLGEFCAGGKGRLKGVGILPTWDLDLAVEELRRIGRAGGFCSAMLPPVPPDVERPYHHPSWEPLWDAYRELDWPVSLHLQGTPSALLARNRTAQIAVSPIACAEPWAVLLFGGLLERRPDLQFVAVETGFGWWPYFLDRLDTTWRRHRFSTGCDLPEPPSFYFRRQVKVTFQEDRAGARTVGLVGEDNVMWADDYPHTDTTWPHSHKVIEEHFGGMPEETRRKIVCDNAARLYGWAE